MKKNNIFLLLILSLLINCSFNQTENNKWVVEVTNNSEPTNISFKEITRFDFDKVESDDVDYIFNDIVKDDFTVIENGETKTYQTEENAYAYLVVEQIDEDQFSYQAGEKGLIYTTLVKYYIDEYGLSEPEIIP